MTSLRSHCLHPMVLIVGLLLAGLAHAHDPGFSTLTVTHHPPSVDVSMAIALDDIDSLLKVDLNGDGNWSDSEWRVARSQLESTATQALLVEGARVELLGVRRDLPDGVVFNYRVEPGSSRQTLQVEVPLLARLPFGHRQLLSQVKGQGLPDTRILSRASSSFPVVLADVSLVDTERPTGFAQFVVEGILHIWIGLDHILFLVSLLLPVVFMSWGHQGSVDARLPRMMLDVARIVTAFTVAHSITLAMATLKIVVLPVTWVEVAIAVTVLLSAAHNLRPFLPLAHWKLAFLFGLVHGFGFANVLLDIGLPPQTVFGALLGFNVGVELGQLAIVIALMPVLLLLRKSRRLGAATLSGGSGLIALLASVWLIQRLAG